MEKFHGKKIERDKFKSVYEFKEYREFMRAYFDLNGRGELGRVAKALNISSSLISLILKGDKNLTPEQASDFVDYLILPELEAEYFSLLVDFDRAGSFKLKQKIEKKLLFLKEQSEKISSRVNKKHELSKEGRNIFYSSWLYSGIRNFSSVGEAKTIKEIADYFHIPISRVNSIVQFLLEQGLIKISKNGYTYNAKITHVDFESSLVNQHHRNWRIKSLNQMEYKRNSDLFFTAPMSLSHLDSEKIRKILLKAIDEIVGLLGPSKSEKVMCLNMDWFEY